MSSANYQNSQMNSIDPSKINIKVEEIKVEDQGMPKFKLDLTAMIQNQKSLPLEHLTKKLPPPLIEKSERVKEQDKVEKVAIKNLTTV